MWVDRGRDQRRLVPPWPWLGRDGRLDLLKATAFALTFYPASWAIWHLSTGGFGPLPLVGLIYWSGVWAAALLLATLAITPLSRILSRPRLITVRRTMGVSALVYSLIHVVVYFALYDWDFGFLATDVVTRPTLIVASASTLGLLMLGATSRDAVMRRMGRNWKRLHRANYILTALALAHYLLSPGIFSMQYIMAGLFIWLMTWRYVDRYRLGADPRTLILLALAAALATVVLEAGWMWAYHGVDPSEPLADNLTIAYGIPAAWSVLVAGLAVALSRGLLTIGSSGSARAFERDGR